jgi:beta-fructofuranosidase
VAGAKAALPAEQQGKALRLQVFLDRSVLEVYANGHLCFTRVVYPGEKDLGLGVFASGGAAKLKSLKVWPMADIGKGI